MNDPVVPPASGMRRFVQVIWKYLPRLGLVGLILMIVLLTVAIGGKKQRLEEARKAAYADHQKQVNAVVLTLHSGPSKRLSTCRAGTNPGPGWSCWPR